MLPLDINVAENKCLFCDLVTKNKKYCSLSCSSKDRPSYNKVKYEKNPKLCLGCEQVIPYKKHWVNLFCSRSCAASVNNTKHPKKTKKQRNKKQTTMERFEQGFISKRDTLKKYLIKLHGNKCFECNLPPIWNNKPLVMVLDHIDGIASNNKPNNLRLLCPCCNSQTNTFCGKNLGKGRGSLGLKLS